VLNPEALTRGADPGPPVTPDYPQSVEVHRDAALGDLGRERRILQSVEASRSECRSHVPQPLRKSPTPQASETSPPW
jgi:hypothetical protein